MNDNPVATYRVQLTPAFGLGAAADILPFLARLGISHLYTSPNLQSVTGSTSGYDVVDPGKVDEELGGAAAHERLTASLRDHGMKRMVDIVPNHMAIAGNDNPWWWDVLENGPASRYAAYFDVDWDASGDWRINRILLPVLGDHFGRVLEAGELTLRYDGERFVIAYHESIFPVEPTSLGDVLEGVAQQTGDAGIAFLAGSFGQLPRPRAAYGSEVDRRHRDKLVLASWLRKLCTEDRRIAKALESELDRLNRTPKALGELIEKQNYRLAFWRAADHDLGYRRFFNINDLVGLRVERADVFRAVHALPLGWVHDGAAHALRVDHPDGLRDPTQYFERLRVAAPDAWIVVEKILERNEELPPAWPVDGTTGYDFLNRVNGLFADPEGEAKLTKFYREFCGEEPAFEEVARDSKRQVLQELLGSEINRLTILLSEICEHHWRHRDYDRETLRRAIIELATAFPVYRTYVRAEDAGISVEDRGYINSAVESIERQDPFDPELCRFLGEILRLEQPGKREEAFAVRFQQLTGPAMAKGIEDTAFYRYHRLVALNEVGGDPSSFGITVSEFHATCEEAARLRPCSMLTTSTHDTKRSEDVRAQLMVLSEIPDRWAEACRVWRTSGHRYRPALIDPNTEYLVYQTLVGAWPIDRKRVAEYALKAVREAKTRTTWTAPDKEYEAALEEWITAIFSDSEMISAVNTFVGEILLPGRLNSLTQTLIKMTAPGVPDIYQGCELWDLSLVDPDNRRPVDFDHRRRLMDALEESDPHEIMNRMEEGLPKLWVIRQSLTLRRRMPEAFGPGASYAALPVRGARAAHAIAFRRSDNVIAVAPRLTVSLAGEWADTFLELPPGRWINCMESSAPWEGQVRLGELFASFPVALLSKEE